MSPPLETEDDLGALPQLTRLARPLAAPDSQRVEPTLRGARVLVIDDELRVASMINRLLRQHHQVEVESDAWEGLRKIRSGNFDVVICDLMMPNLGGREIYQILIEQLPDQARKMVFITGGAFTNASAEFLERMQGRVLHKPFRAQALRALVESTWQQH